MYNKILFGSCMLLIASFLMAFISIYPVLAANGGLPTIDKTWTCSNGFPSQYCSSESAFGICYPQEYLFMWDRNTQWGLKEYNLEYNVDVAGPYKCEIEVITNHFEHRDNQDQLDEITEVWFEGQKIGETIDPWCPVTTNGNGDDDDDEGCTPSECDAEINNCKWHYYSWYGQWTGRRCDGVNACQYPNYGGGHSCGGPGLCPEYNAGSAYWSEYFFTDFGSSSSCTGLWSNCCGDWHHGAWCGYCDHYSTSTTTISVNKHCWDINYGESYCETRIRPNVAGAPRCEWYYDHNVLAGIAGEGMPNNNNNGVLCSAAAVGPRGTDGFKYHNLLGAYHYGDNSGDPYFAGKSDLWDANFICCFAAKGSLEDGMDCVIDDECENNNCALKNDPSKDCQEATSSERKAANGCTCSGAVSNQKPDKPTFVIKPTECEINKDCVFRVKATDPDGDRIRYQFDWRDGNTEYVPADPNSVASGTERQKAHQYTTAGTYTFRVRAQERVSPGVFGQYSDYAKHTFQVKAPGSTCNNDGYCLGGENPDNCPNDCEYYDICADVFDCDYNAGYGRKGFVDSLDECDDDFDCVGCFPAGTKISMADGSLKDIENIEKGDRVFSFNGRLLTQGEVTYVHTPVKDRLYLLTTESSELLVTGEHPLYAGDGEFVRVEELEIGDEVYVFDGYGISEERITHKELLDDYVYVYNFDVDGETYFADGFAVHNKEPPPV